jgi:hypothetical protein
MASTRNRNTQGDYNLQQFQNNGIMNFNTYNSYGVPTPTYFPGNGLLHGRFASENLSNNSCDIESMLRGIGSTNLVAPIPETRPEIKLLKSLSVMDKTPVFLPDIFEHQPNQRPYRGD